MPCTARTALKAAVHLDLAAPDASCLLGGPPSIFGDSMEAMEAMEGV